MLELISAIYPHKVLLGKMRIVKIFFLISALFLTKTEGQSKFNDFLKPSDSLNLSRKNSIIISEAFIASISLIGLDQLWYSDFERSKFRTINDTNEWLQMDKLGHSYSAYQLSRVGANIMGWAGTDDKTRILNGTAISLGFLTAVEIFDGFSKEWGFSWSDMAANAAGTGFFVGQELLWKEQRILLKYSFHQTKFAKQRPDKLGNGLIEEMFKDYNGQTYWLSANLHSFFKNDKIPKWINLAFGYGAEGMLTGHNETLDGQFPNQNRYRQFYISLDVDFSRIKTNSHILRTLFDVFNLIKVPFPTLSFNGQNGTKLHLIYF